MELWLCVVPDVSHGASEVIHMYMMAFSSEGQQDQVGSSEEKYSRPILTEGHLYAILWAGLYPLSNYNDGIFFWLASSFNATNTYAFYLKCAHSSIQFNAMLILNEGH